MAAGRCDFIIDQGEDWTCQLVWTDYFDNPVKISPPMRMTIKSPYGQVAHELTVPEAPPAPDEIPSIAYNTESGLIQLHLDDTVTASMAPGRYAYDLFVNVTNTEAYAGTQQSRLIYGDVIVRPRITKVV